MKRVLIFVILSFAFIQTGCNSDSGDLQPEVVKYIPEPTPDTMNPEVAPVDPLKMHDPIPVAEAPKTPDLQVPTLPELQPYQSQVDPNRTFERPTVDRQDQEEVVPFQPMTLKPKIDILFVIDDSLSMLAHQINLSRNINRFVSTFAKNDQLDYQIAVTSIYDTNRYFKDSSLPADDERNLQGVTEMSRLEPGKRNFYRMGQLVPVPNATNGETFVTSETPNSLSTLSKLLKIGTKNFVKSDKVHSENGKLIEEAYGPRYEEMLYPMLAAVDVKQLLFGNNASFFRSQYPKSQGWDPASNDWAGFAKAFNKNFPRPDAHLAIIFVTDTLDQSYRLSAQQVKAALVALKNDPNFEKISTYGVLHPNSLSQRVRRSHSQRFAAKCKADEDVRDLSEFQDPQLLESFLSLTRGEREEGSNIFNICHKNYGDQLAQVGTEIRTKRLKRLEIPLNFIPERDRIKVTYSGTPILDSVSNQKQSKPKAFYWKYRSHDKTLVIYNLDQFAATGNDNKIEVDFSIIDPNQATTDSSVRIGQ